MRRCCLAVILIGCSRGPLDRPAGQTEWYELTLGGVRIGSEERVATSSGVWRQATYRWSLPGGERTVVTTSVADMDPRGQVVAYRRKRMDEPEGVWSGAAWLPELAVVQGTLPQGTVSVLDPRTLEVSPINVRRDGETWRWMALGVEVVATRDGAIRQGGLQTRHVESRPVLTAVDPINLVRRPGPRIADARRSKRADFRLDGELKRVAVPLDLEVTAEWRARTARWVRQVQRRLDHAPSPGTPDALKALQEGRGDCNEYAAVLVNMAVSEGFEAREVSGVVYTDSEAFGPGLDLHAWAEVRVPEVGWLPVDPALGQPIADATHLPLARGRDLERAMAILASETRIELVAVR